MNFASENDFNLYITEKYSTDINVHFSSPIELNDNYNFEISLVSISFGKKYKNIYSSEIEYYSFEKDTVQKTSIPNRFYETEEEFVVAFNKSFDNSSKKYYNLKYENGSFLLSCGTDGVNPPFISLSQDIQCFSGLNHTYTTQGVHINEKGTDFTGGNGLIFVFCSQIQNVHIGSKTGPLLCTVPFGLGSASSSLYYHQPIKPLHIPVISHCLTGLQIQICNAHGDFFPFDSNPDLCLTLNVCPKLGSI